MESTDEFWVSVREAAKNYGGTISPPPVEATLTYAFNLLLERVNFLEQRVEELDAKGGGV